MSDDYSASSIQVLEGLEARVAAIGLRQPAMAEPHGHARRMAIRWALS